MLMKGFHVYFGILLLYLLFACLVFFNIFAICYFSNERKKIEETTSASDRFGPYKTDLGLNCLLGKQ